MLILSTELNYTAILFMAISKQKVQAMYQSGAKHYDFTTILFRLIGLRMKAYRLLAIKKLFLQRGDFVIELGCGTGLNFPLLMEQIGPEGRLVGVDFTTGMLDIAQARIKRSGWENIEIDDAYWGGRKKGKRGRGSPNKAPFVAAIEKIKDGKPNRIKLQVVSGFRKVELEMWARSHLTGETSVLSDGLAYFTGIKNAGYGHSSIVAGNSKDAKKTVAFKWVNIILGNLKTALVGTFHKLSNKHLPRHLATFQYRFNRRYRLKDMIPRLAYMAARTPPMPARLLKLAENHW